MFKLLRSILHNEKLLLRGNLSRLDDLGGVYIKFLQVVVLNINSNDQENFLELLSVYEHSKPDNLDIVRYLQHADLPNDSLLASVESSPFATGSFGQVYAARLVSGKEVVVKVLRPSVIKYLNYDLRLLNIVSFLYSLIDRQKMINFRQVYKEFKKTCQEETNYLLEAQAADYYYQQYTNHPYITMPRVYADLSTKQVIVQDRIDGLSVASLLAIQNSKVNAVEYVGSTLGSDLFLQLYTVGYELLSKALTGEMLHADPHPGNIILLPENKVAIIDFGIVTELRNNRGAFFELLLQYRSYYRDSLAIEDFTVAALQFLTPDLYAAIQQADTVFGSNASQKFIEKIKHATLAIAHQGQASTIVDGLLKQKQIMKVLFFVINKGNRFGLNFDLESLTMLKAAQTYLTVIGQFDHNAIIIERVVSDVVNFADQHLERIVSSTTSTVKPEEAIEILSTWFDKMSRNDPWLMQKLAGGYIK